MCISRTLEFKAVIAFHPLFSLNELAICTSISHQLGTLILYIPTLPQNPKTLKQNMNSVFLKNRFKVSHVIMLQKQLIFTNPSINPIKLHSLLCNKFHSKPYFRLPDFLRKTRQYEISPSLFSSSFCSSSSSSSATTASPSKVGFVGWYLGMIKKNPILTKSVTSALIYIAADLSSQVHLSTFI